MKKILITSSGFLGYHLANKLKDNRNNMIYIVDTVNKIDKYFKKLCQNKNVEYIEGDLTKDHVYKFIDLNTEYIYHLVDKKSTPLKTVDSTINSTIKLLNFAKETKCKKFLFGSKFESRVNSSEFIKEDNPIILEDIYSQDNSFKISKLVSENYVANFCVDNKLEHNILRYFNIYGERMGDKSVVPSIIYRILNNRNGKIELNGGNCLRSFLYIKDAIRNTISVMDGFPQGTFNIGSNEETPIADIVDILSILLRTDFEIDEKGKPLKTVLRKNPDLTKFEYYFGKQENLEFSLGLKQVYQWYKKEYEK
jgi:nucleoside-diphosphate-sugar epimerase